MTKINRRKAIAASAFFLAASSAIAQGANTSIYVPYAAGGSSDVIARLSAPYISAALGENVIVENVVGATGAIAIQKIKNSPANGKLIYQGTAGELIIPPLTNDTVKFVPEDMEAVHPITVSNLVLVVRKSLPVNNIQEFIELAKSKSATAPLSYGSPGIGSLYHLIPEAMSKQSGALYNHIPYKGANPMLQDLIGERIDFAVMAFIRSMPEAAKSGQYKIIANMHTSKQNELSHLPTLSEYKEFSGMNFLTGSTFFVKKGTPAEVKEKINKAIVTAVSNADLVKKLELEGRAVSKPMDLAQSQSYYQKEIDQYKKLISLTGFKVTN